MNNENNQKPIPEFLSEKMLIEQLNLSRTSLWRLRNDKSNPLPFFRVRGKIFYRWSEVLNFLERV